MKTFKFENFLGVHAPRPPEVARAFGVRNSYPYHEKSPNFSLIISRLDIAYNSNINYLVPVLEVRIPPPPPPTSNEKSGWLRPSDRTGFCQKIRSYLPVALLVEIDEKAARIDGKLVEIRHEFTLDEEVV